MVPPDKRMVLACRVLGLLLTAPLVFGMSCVVVLYQLGLFARTLLSEAACYSVAYVVASVATSVALLCLCIASRAWSKKGAVVYCVCLTVIIAGLAGAAAVAWYGFLRVNAHYDSDTEAVPRDIIDAKLKAYLGCELPANAKNVRVLITGSFSSCLYLRFEGNPEDLREFVGRAIRTPALADVRAQVKQSPELLARWPEKDWWKPRTDIPSWYVIMHDCDTFVQWDKENGVVYVMRRVGL
jgi:hypothetical protein